VLCWSCPYSEFKHILCLLAEELRLKHRLGRAVHGRIASIAGVSYSLPVCLLDLMDVLRWSCYSSAFKLISRIVALRSAKAHPKYSIPTASLSSVAAMRSNCLALSSIRVWHQKSKTVARCLRGLNRVSLSLLKRIPANLTMFPTFGSCSTRLTKLF
jgi:hypothetical protein